MNAEWYFPPNCGGEETGLNDSGIETFRSSGDLAREVVQNSIDARAGDAPVRVRVELRNVARAEVPGADRLEAIIGRCLAYLQEQCETQAQRREAGEDTLVRAQTMLAGATVPVLAIHDSETTGLEGDDTAPGSAWYRLVRAQGTPRRHGAQGGTFGIGQRAPFAFSCLRTILYSSHSANGSRFIGKSILSSFREHNEIYRNVGHYGSPQGEKNGAFGLVGDAIPTSFRRVESGTSLYILGYESAAWQFEMSCSIVENFFAAVEHGSVVVEIVDAAGQVTRISSDTLSGVIENLIAEAPNHASSRRDARELVDALKRTRWYLHALRHPHGGTAITAALKHIGTVQLFIALDPDAPEKTIYMRRPRIAVYERTRHLGAGYAGVFVCDDTEGNRRLAGLEDPTHKKWERDRADGASIVGELTRWVNQQITEIVQTSPARKESAPELGQYLPASEERSAQPDAGVARKTNLHRDDESAREQKKPAPHEKQSPTKHHVAPPKVDQLDEDAEAGEEDSDGVSGDAPATVPGDVGGPGPDHGDGVGGDGDGNTGTGGPGDHGGGSSGGRPVRALRPSEITFRCFYDAQDRSTRLVLRSARAGSIAPTLVAIGEDGRAYEPPIERVVESSTGRELAISRTRLGKIDAITISAIPLVKGALTEVRIHMRHGVRASLSVEGVHAP